MMAQLRISVLIGRLTVVILAVIGSSALAVVAPATRSERRHHHRLQHGPCSYTFLLPEVEHCRPAPDFHLSNSLQRDSALPPAAEQHWTAKRLEELEGVMENNTEWLLKLENYIQDSVKLEMVEMQRTAAHNQTAAMLEIGTNLLSQTAEQTRKLTDVEMQMLNQTSRLEIQLLENSLSTNKLEKQVLLQTQEITKLHDKNSFLEQRFVAMEERHSQELQGLKAEKLQLQDLVARQSSFITELERELGSATSNSTLLQKQQAALMDTVHQLLSMVNQCNEISMPPKEEVLRFKDCAEVYKSGLKTSGVYTLHYLNSTETVKVFCDMETSGGGWTVLQHRMDGAVDFHRPWKDYKTGFGDPYGEYWLGNDFLHQLTSSGEHTLRIVLKDWENNKVYSQYDHFHTDSEERNYRLHVKGFSGTAGRTSSLSHSGTEFSTKDRDNDKCGCKCAEMATGGWWFDACGPSNLNGIYYAGNTNMVRYNGIKWYYWKGPSLSLKETTMMIKPVDF
ncbi:angiopoietin-2b [Polyodon spathula]|uniref:angiopoietin-2b n=1 Tax=Polyodon spathula TaxID=7913 RepID=UPI001B7F212A|nr:angiopoietin-2b [Polyodon spathula]